MSTLLLNRIATKFGDLIEFSYPIGYSHFGVYDEDGHIIHFAVTAYRLFSLNCEHFAFVRYVEAVCNQVS
ncbi:uncharacterized protein ACWYII_017453 [Salvelinus alpinus]